MNRPLVALMICIALAFAVILTTARPVQAGGVKNAASDDGDIVDARDYCVKKGGEVDVRAPYFNTNDDNQQDWFRFSGDREFCKFTALDGSRIHVLLSTLYTDKPTLAGLAYYAKLPLSGTCNGNPASCYCSQLGGSDLFGGINANGGGWVQKSDPVDTVLEACIFPDMSTIDSWGLTYHSVGKIRGKNLNHVLRYPNPYAK